MHDKAVCRFAKEEDGAQVQALWTQCFDDTSAFVEWYFQRYYQKENTLGIFADDTLLASAQMIPYTIALRGAEVPAAYIVGVDTLPEARNQGCASRLLLECLQTQRERGQAINLLMPFEGQFYYRYGWPFCYFHQQMEIKPQELRCAAHSWGHIRQVELLEAIPALQPIYNQFVQHYHGAVCRTIQQWQLLMEDAALEHTACYLLEKDGQAMGYCLWVPLRGKIFIREMAWCNAAAKAGLLHFLLEAVPAQQLLWLELPDEDELVFSLAAEKKKAVRYPFLMARIVDVAQCLRSIQYPQIDGRLLLYVKDDFARWNHGFFSVEVQQGRARVQPVASRRGIFADVRITIDGLSQLVLGARSAAQLKRQQLLQVKDDQAFQLLQQLWPPQSNYINEYY